MQTKECEVQDVGCYTSKDLCDSYYEEQKNSKACQAAGDRGASCGECLSLQDCVYDTEKGNCLSGAGFWFRPEGYAYEKSACSGGDDRCSKKKCGDVCDTSLGMLQVMQYCQPDGSCASNSAPACQEKPKTCKKDKDCKGKSGDPCETSVCQNKRCETQIVDCMPPRCENKEEMPVSVPGQCCKFLPCGVTDVCFIKDSNKKQCKARAKAVGKKCKINKKSKACAELKVPCKRVKNADDCSNRDDCKAQSKKGKFKKCLNK